jgi:uncharacterized protein (UPF0332 family)
MITPLEFLTLADQWVLAPREGEWRCAVSRAYYAAFHRAGDFMRGLGFQVPRSDRAHAYLWMRLSNAVHPPLVQAGRDLGHLRTERNQADYELTRTLLQSNARLSVLSARQILQILDACELEPTRTQVRDAMRDYERNALGTVTWQGP